MVNFLNSISVCNSVDQPSIMANSVNSNDFLMNSKSSSSRKQKVSTNSPSSLKIRSCERSRSAAIDVFILIAVIAACGFLLFPTIKCMSLKLIELIEAAFYLFKEEIVRTPMIYASIGLDGAKRGLFELPPDHHKELETELKKMPPVNGRAVLVFQARCGCSVGRLEVPGPKKQRKPMPQGVKYFSADMPDSFYRIPSWQRWMSSACLGLAMVQSREYMYCVYHMAIYAGQEGFPPFLYTWMVNEAEMMSLNQQKRIEELEAQLGEVEDIVRDLRAELREVQDELEKLTKNSMQCSSEQKSGHGVAASEEMSNVKTISDFGSVALKFCP
ncbi:hypothetical protein GOBAR_DD24373 [Gossypium barbadense]|nr:hypothetical protein GOBAR_DD24373 [Gossypium barbadense]